MSTISSRTPEGWDNRCPICKHDCTIEPSGDSYDAPCPNCGHLIWFANWGIALVSATDLARLSNPEFTAGTLPNDLTVAPQILGLCTQQMAIGNCILPIDCSADAVLIAMHDPSNVELIDKIRFVLNLDIRILHVDQDSLQRQIQACYGVDY